MHGLAGRAARQRPSPATLRQRLAEARAMLLSCEMCELRCGVDRRAPHHAPCGLSSDSWCFKRHLSLAEEIELIPSYMVYLGGCNFRCCFCAQGPTCFHPAHGAKLEADAAARDFAERVADGARTINLLGGEPTLHLQTLLEIACEADTPLPLVVNSNMYMTPRVLELLDGVVELYLADFKFGNDACAARLAGIDNYLAVVQRNLRLAAAQTDIIIRHLLMPGHLDCCLRPVAAWVAATLPDVRFSLMTGYVPCYRSSRDGGTLSRCLLADERRKAERLVKGLGLRSESD